MTSDQEREIMAINQDLVRLLPEGCTHCVVEERSHRGQSVFAVVAIVPNGIALPLNGYSSETLAGEICAELNATL